MDVPFQIIGKAAHLPRKALLNIFDDPLEYFRDDLLSTDGKGRRDAVNRLGFDNPPCGLYKGPGRFGNWSLAQRFSHRFSFLEAANKSVDRASIGTGLFHCFEVKFEMANVVAFTTFVTFFVQGDLIDHASRDRVPIR